MSTSSSSILFCIQQKVLWLFYPFIFFNTRKEKGMIIYLYSNGGAAGRLIKATWKKSIHQSGINYTLVMSDI